MDYTLPEWLRLTGLTIYWVCQVALLYPLWVAWQRREFWSRPLQVLFWVLLAIEGNVVFVDGVILTYALPQTHDYAVAHTLSNVPFVHIQWNLHGLGHIAVFYTALQGPTLRKWLRVWVGLLVVISLIDTFYWNPFWQYKTNMYAQLSQYITVVVLCVFYFEQLLQQLHTRRIETNPMFWVTVYAVILFAGTMVAGALLNEQQGLPEPQAKFVRAIFGLVNSSITLIAYGVLTVAFRCCGREQEIAPRPRESGKQILY